MTSAVTRFEPRVAPCGQLLAGERFVTEDQQGLVTEELRYDCGCAVSKEEFHDGSVHLMTVDHKGKVLTDQELRGE